MRRNPAIFYPLLGGLFGMLFPIVSAIVIFHEHALSFSISNFIYIHYLSTLQWIIDTAPFFLGIFAYFSGIREHRLLRLNRDLEIIAQERETLIDQLNQTQQEQSLEIIRATRQLESAAKITQEANLLRDLQQLLDEITALVSKQFDFNLVGIYLFDPSGNYIELKSASSTDNHRNIHRGSRLEIDDRSIVGCVAYKGLPHLIQDYPDDSNFLHQLRLPETQSELALPLQVLGTTIGVLYLQSKAQLAFSEQLITVMQIIADSVAISIQNAVYHSETQANLDEIQNLHRLYLEKSWKEVVTTQGVLEYTYFGHFPEEDDLNNDKDRSGSRHLQIPLKIRNLEIGSIDIESEMIQIPGKNGQEWLPEEQLFVESVAAQFALALENARLLEEAKRFAQRSQFFSDVSTRIHQSLDLESVVRNAVQIIHRELGAEEVIISLGEPPNLIKQAA